MQLSIFDVLSEMPPAPAAQPSLELKIFEGFKEYSGQEAFEKIQSFAKRYFNLRYSNPYVQLQVPIKIDKFEMCETPKPLFSMGRMFSTKGSNYESFVHSGSKQLYHLLEKEEDGSFQFTYADKKLYSPVQEFLFKEMPCLSNVKLQEYKYEKEEDLSPFEEIKSLKAANEVIECLIGKTVRVEFYLRDELFWNITSMPFKVEEIKVNGDELSIKGTNGVLLYANHFQNVRNQYPSILFDSFIPDHGYFSYCLKTCQD